MGNEARRPLFRRFQNREAYNPASSNGGKRVLGGEDNTNNFAGEFALNNPLGTYWNNKVQAGALALSEGSDSEVGGFDRVKITADGSGITVPGAWVNIGAGAIDTTNGAVNIIRVWKVANSEVNYDVFVVV